MTIKYKELKVTAWNPKGKSYHKIKIPHYEKNQTVPVSYVRSMLKGKGVKGMTKLKYSTSIVGESAGKVSKPITRSGGSTSGSYGDEMDMGNRMNKHDALLRKIEMDRDARERYKRIGKFWAKVRKEKGLTISPTEDGDDNEPLWEGDKSPFKGGDTKEKSTPYTNPHNKAKQLARKAMKELMKRKEKSLNEVKKLTPDELKAMKPRERNLFIMKAKEEAKKRKAGKDEKAARLTSNPSASEINGTKKKENLVQPSRLDWFNSQPVMQKWLRANVHPADRERVMNDIWNAPSGKAHEVYDDYESGKRQYRKMPKATL